MPLALKPAPSLTRQRGLCPPVPPCGTPAHCKGDGDGGARDIAPRVDSLTGLRFLAALAVFVHHFTGISSHGGVAHAPLLFPYSTMGVHGVGFFFVLSGFLLTWGHRPGTRAGLFYWRRIGRIGPAHIAAAVPCVWVFYLWGGIPTDDFSFLASVFLVQTWFPGVTPTLPGNPVSWTLGVEAFFYLLFPFLIRFALRPRTRTLALLACAGLAAMWAVNWWAATHLSPFATEWIMRHPITRLPEFGAGMVCALALRRGHRLRINPPAVALAFVAYAVVYCHRETVDGPGPGQLDWTVRPLVGAFAALLITAYVQRELAGRRGWLCSRPMVRLGLWSYAFYLLHQTLNRLYVDTWGQPQPANSALFTLIGVAAVVTALSWAMFTYVEEPARKWWARHTPRALTVKRTAAQASWRA
ncbi:acyltransferase family protein [Streptomyces sp. NPDC050658]|uniref:acyltransferase family protein n=1 Tax=unclassified Streptomyces TaxID=2593676 RepID=UPI00343DA292